MHTPPDTFTSAGSVKTLNQLIDRNLSVNATKNENRANAGCA